jgi:glycosyltransferase involved in cell wall biosynthesis
MRVGIDARFLTHPQAGGFKTYTQHLVRAITALDRVNEYVLYVDRPPDADRPVSRQPNVRTRIVPAWIPRVGMVWREQVGLAAQASRDRLDLLHCLTLTSPLRIDCPVVLTLHDTLWRDLPLRLRPVDWYYRIVPRLAAARAASIITVSRFAHAEICLRLGVPADRVFVTPEAAGPAFARIEDQSRIDAVLARTGLRPGFVLALASADPRKNATTLVRAYAELPEGVRRRHPLVLVWSHRGLTPALLAEVTRLGLRSSVRFLFGVSESDLAVLYNAASMFAFPSLGEGFGLPLLEAMACGTPVVAVNASSVPEVAGDAALLCDGASPQALTAAMLRVLADDSLRAALIRRGLARAASFSWERCAQQTLACYARTLEQTQMARARLGARGFDTGATSARPLPAERQEQVP